MRNEDQWVPTKFVHHKGSLKATKNRDELSVGSRLIASIVADLYGQALPIHATGRLLDMGCGQVPFYAAYRDHVRETVCIDWANSPHRIEHLDMECDLTGEIPFPDASFDTVILSDVLEHLPDPKLCWQEIARLLKPGGKLIMNVPFYAHCIHSRLFHLQTSPRRHLWFRHRRARMKCLRWRPSTASSARCFT